MASGQVVAFLDDDAVADANWLKFMVDSYEEPGCGRGRRPHAAKVGHSAAVLVPGGIRLGGRMHLRGNADVPRARAQSAGRQRLVHGGRSSNKVGGFKSGIGRAQGKRPLGCEETEFCIRLNQQCPARFCCSTTGRRSGIASPPSVPGSRTTAPGATPKDSRRRWSPGASAPMTGSRPSAATAPGPFRGALSGGLPTRSTVTARALGRAGAIIAGLATVTAGYAVGALSGITEHRRRSGRRSRHGPGAVGARR